MDRLGCYYRHAQANSLGFLVFRDGQALGCVYAVNPTLVDDWVLRAKHVMHPSVTPASAFVGHINDIFA